MEYHSSGCHSCWLGTWLCSTEKAQAAAGPGRVAVPALHSTTALPEPPQHGHALLLLGKWHPGAPDLSHNSKTDPQHPPLIALSGGKKKSHIASLLEILPPSYLMNCQC